MSAHIEECRQYVMDLLGAKGLYLLLEAQKAIILQFWAIFTPKKKGTVLYSAVEHPAVINACLQAQKQGFNVEEIKVNSFGIVDLELLEKQLKAMYSLYVLCM